MADSEQTKIETDLERATSFLERADVGYERAPYKEGVAIIIDQETSKKFNGYNRFFVEMHFDLDGKFLNIGAFE